MYNIDDLLEFECMYETAYIQYSLELMRISNPIYIILHYHSNECVYFLYIEYIHISYIAHISYMRF